GVYTVNTHKRTINFHNKVNLEIRSPDLFFCDTLSNVLANIHDVTLGKNLITLDYYEIGTCDYIPSKIKIKMLSPLVVYHSFENKTYYHDPLDEDYAGYINRNFIKKFLAVFGEMPPSSIKLTPLAIGLKDKYVTTFKRNTYITGWKGIYLLEGDPECLKYVYECGLGSKNSQGFGMFEIISEVTTH
ncbi:MAG: CRISPR-associated endoribonuclease Cas6, partial [Erysipelotrichaceae bacterium]|nr:CRISPR-associated endoribonuclease Cas6 [Erysipelotrichaceae bacterium]